MKNKKMKTKMKMKTKVSKCEKNYKSSHRVGSDPKLRSIRFIRKGDLGQREAEEKCRQMLRFRIVTWKI